MNPYTERDVLSNNGKERERIETKKESKTLEIGREEMRKQRDKVIRKAEEQRG